MQVFPLNHSLRALSESPTDQLINRSNVLISNFAKRSHDVPMNFLIVFNVTKLQLSDSRHVLY